MLRTRVIPILLLYEGSIVKTVKFNKHTYIGDPCNTVRIFNELEVDELILLDINASRQRQPPDFKLLGEISNECFMPLAYGGGISTLQEAKNIFNLGFEKISLNSAAMENSQLITDLSRYYGSQAIIGSIDVSKSFWGEHRVWSRKRRNAKKKIDPVLYAKELEKLGVGEILLTSIDREGTWEGFDNALVKSVSNAVNIPVIANGGAGCLEDIRAVVNEGKASAVGLGSLVVFQKKGMGALVNFPDQKALRSVIK